MAEREVRCDEEYKRSVLQRPILHAKQDEHILGYALGSVAAVRTARAQNMPQLARDDV